MTCIAVLDRVPTGCKTLDRDLNGGISSRSVSLIYGEAETGKTTLAMQLAVNCALKGSKTLFIDCDGTFSAKRLSQVAAQRFDEIAELIILMRPSNFAEQATTVDRLPEYLTDHFGLVVVDTLTSLYRVKIAEYPRRAFELNRELNRQLALLAQISKMYKIAVLAVSQVSASFKEEQVSIEPVATRVLKFWADTIIDLKPTGKTKIVKLVLEKAPKLQPTTYYLSITESGIHECPIH